MSGAPTQGSAGIARTRDGRDLFHQALPEPAGTAAPIVVFESGLAASRSFWGLVQPLVARWSRTVAYDRSGLGRSPPDSQPRSIERMAEDLNELLDHLGHARFVLVAHSGGGPIVRAAAAACPDRIAGLVLVDVSDEACPIVFEKSFVRLEKFAHGMSWLLARLGLLEGAYRKAIAPLPDDVRADLSREGFTMEVMRTRGAELAGLRGALESFRATPPQLPDVPVTVISGGLADFGMSQRIRDEANAAHRYRAAQSPEGKHVVARNSGHAPILSEPELVAEEIRQVLAKAPVPNLTEFTALTVVAASQLTPHMRRITFKGTGLHGFATNENLHVGLLLPPPGASRTDWLQIRPDGKASIRDTDTRPVNRKYTLRTIDADGGQATIDFVLHEDGGPGGTWAAQAQAGDIVGIIGPGGRGLTDADWHLIAGDETALPAIGRMLETMPEDARGQVLIEIANAAEEQPLRLPPEMRLQWLHRNASPAGTTNLLREAVEAVVLPSDGVRPFCWVGAEFTAAQAIREHLRRDKGVARNDQLVVAYWRLGGDEMTQGAGK